MIGIIISGHGAFASGIYSAIKVIAGEQTYLATCDFMEGMSTEDLTSQMEEALEAMHDTAGIVFFTDLKGGTPFKVAATLSVNHPAREVLAGSNVAMLLESVLMRNFVETPTELALKAVETGQQQVYRFVMETKAVVEESEDGI